MNIWHAVFDGASGAGYIVAVVNTIPTHGDTMPLIHVSLFEGRTVEQKREFAKAVTAESARILKCAPESVDIIFEDVKKSDWASSGKLASDS